VYNIPSSYALKYRLCTDCRFISFPHYRLLDTSISLDTDRSYKVCSLLFPALALFLALPATQIPFFIISSFAFRITFICQCVCVRVYLFNNSPLFSSLLDYADSAAGVAATALPALCPSSAGIAQLGSFLSGMRL